ncbi:hypothetical protein [Agitococcus lubricus]|uniref:Uncharacterized protein n=1 Tax=Agitococcus lubricus TaxID=1077255 RepID=A0A2T5J2D6_9GAMM|nr:hypothetical protein [Agitococcus lubricus]PTQ90493.1 hypothetical protein C8N29_103248 [Agitococcus lubricus]
MEREKHQYQATVWVQDNRQPGERTTIVAFDLEDAERQLKQKYGENIIYSLYSEDDANRTR